MERGADTAHTVKVPIDFRPIVKLLVAQQIETMLANALCPPAECLTFIWQTALKLSNSLLYVLLPGEALASCHAKLKSARRKNTHPIQKRISPPAKHLSAASPYLVGTHSSNSRGQSQEVLSHEFLRGRLRGTSPASGHARANGLLIFLQHLLQELFQLLHFGIPGFNSHSFRARAMGSQLPLSR